MKPKKSMLSGFSGALSREEMKGIVGGTAVCCHYYNQDGTSNFSYPSSSGQCYNAQGLILRIEPLANCY